MDDQQLSQQSQLTSATSKRVAIPADEKQLTARIAEVVGDEPRSSFARRCGIGESLLRGYLSGSIPSALRLVAIADAAGVSLEWLATGRGPKKRAGVPAQVVDVPLGDLGRLTRSVAAVEEGLQAAAVKLPPAKYAELVAAAYQLMGSPSASSEHIVQFIRAAHR